MSLMTQEQEKVDDRSTPVVPLPEQTTPLKAEQTSIPSSSVVVPKLGSGPQKEPDNDVDDELDDDNDVFYDIEPSSGEQLQGLAKPKVFPGPMVDLARTIVSALEETIPELDVEAETKWTTAMAALQKESKEFNEVPHTLDEATAFKEAHLRRQRMLPTSKYDRPILYVGSIELNGVPGSKEDETALYDSAKLIGSADNALGGNVNASTLPKLAGVENQLVFNTIATMIKAGQIDYLRKAGFVGKGWKIVIELHYYRNRTGAAPNLHKDTLGQTLFVNLNYTNEDPMPGPEWLQNPPLVPSHEESNKKKLPKEFLDDLDETRTGPVPNIIETQTLPAYGVVSFVDDTIHHATPLVGFREVTIASLKQFLQSDDDFKALYAKADTAFQDSKKQGKWSNLPWWSFNAYFLSVKDTPTKNLWGALMGLCNQKDTVKINRKILLAAGMSHDQIDRVLILSDSSGFAKVSIPSTAREDGVGTSTPITGPDGKPKPLRRRMSLLALKEDLPPQLPEEAPRRFFRTWVRAVRV